jgi:predicted nucleic acid-binding Zn ribbon protein
MWTTIKKILPFNIRKLGLGQVLELNEICSGWDKMLGSLFGEKFKNKAKPISLKNKTLIVDCMNSVWAGELQLKQIKIIQHINNIFGKELVEKIRFIS